MHPEAPEASPEYPIRVHVHGPQDVSVQQLSASAVWRRQAVLDSVHAAMALAEAWARDGGELEYWPAPRVEREWRS